VGESDVACGHQSGLLKIDQAVTEQVLAQQHLARAANEASKVELGGRQLQAGGVPGEDLRRRYEQGSAADVGDQAGDDRVAVVDEADDDVAEPAQPLTGGVDDSASQQLRQHQAEAGRLLDASAVLAGHVRHRAPPRHVMVRSGRISGRQSAV
jgi:hypothetical protein